LGRVTGCYSASTIEKEGEPGRLIETGPTDRIFSRPANPRTEAYVSGRFG
jgi:phosphate transport system ATP-binding protein